MFSCQIPNNSFETILKSESEQTNPVDSYGGEIVFKLSKNLYSSIYLVSLRINTVCGIHACRQICTSIYLQKSVEEKLFWMFNVFDRNVKGDLDGIDIDDVVTGLFAMVGIEKSIFVF